MRVGDLLLAELAAHEGVHRPALDGAGTDEGDLDRELVELPRLEAREQPHLRAGLDLEHPDRVGAAEHVVDRGLLLRQGGQRPLLAGGLAHQVEAVPQGGEHPEPEQVELHQPHPGRGVFVPLDDGALLHPGVLDGNDLADRAPGEHHAAGVDPQVAGRAQQLIGVGDHLLRDVVVWNGAQIQPPALHLTRPGVLLAWGVPERAGHVAHRVLRAVLDDVRDLRGVLPPVALVDPLDDLLAPPRVEVDVDVRLLGAGRGEEALEGQAVEDRIHRGDAEQVADHARGGGSASLAQDPAVLRLLHDPVHDEEVAREVLLLDHVQLPLDAASPLGGELLGGVLRVPLRHRRPDQRPQMAHRGLARGDAHRGQRGLGAAQREGAGLGDLEARRDRPRVAGEARRHLRTGAQVRGAVRGQPALELPHAAGGAHGCDRLGELCPLRRRVVHVVRRDHGQAVPEREGGEGVVAPAVERIAVVDELDSDPVRAEQVDEGEQRPLRALRPLPFEGAADAALAAAGEDRPMPLGAVRQRLDLVERPPLLAPAQLRFGDRGGEAVVALLATGQHEQVLAERIREPPPLRGRQEPGPTSCAGTVRIGTGERQLRPEHGLQRRPCGLGVAVFPSLRLRLLLRVRQGLRGLGEVRGAVEAVVVGDRESGEPEPLRLGDEVLGGGRAVEEGVRGMRVQLGVGDRVLRSLDPLHPDGRALVHAGGRVHRDLLMQRTGTVRGFAVRSVVAGCSAAEGALQRGPRHVRVVEAHQWYLPSASQCPL